MFHVKHGFPQWQYAIIIYFYVAYYYFSFIMKVFVWYDIYMFFVENINIIDIFLNN